MPDWLNNIWNGIRGRVRDLIDAALSSIRALWNTVVNLFHIVRRSWQRLYTTIAAFAGQLDAFVSDVANAVHNIVFRVIPRFVSRAVDGVIRLARRELTQLGRTLRDLFNGLRDFAVRQLNTLGAALHKLSAFAVSKINGVLDWVGRVGNKVADLVLHPERLVTWILPALWRPLWAFISSHAEPIGRWMLARSIAAVLRSASIIESAIARIL